MHYLISPLSSFWQQHPSLFYGLAVLLGTIAALNGSPILLFPLFLMSLFSPTNKGTIRRVLLGYALGIMAFIMVVSTHQFPEVPLEGISGTAYLNTTNLSENKTSFGEKWLYKGIMQTFVPDDSANKEGYGSNVPVVISLPQSEEIRRPLADKSYRLHVLLKQSKAGYYIINVKRNEPWIPLAGTWSSAEWRFHAKKTVSQYIRNSITNERAATFLSGIATGDFNDRLMSFEFGRFGLQHIMAISGFHFAIVSSILCFILRFFISTKKAYLLLIFFLTSYFLFLGFGSSVMRAWITILIALGGFLVERPSFGLNSLGFAMLVILCLDPLQCLSIGFQFSFLTTAAILLFMGAVDNLLRYLLKKRSLSQAVTMNLLNQHGYCVLAIFRQALALGIAVNLVALPMTLFYFHKFPWMSIIYNLFFPFMVSLAMLLLILGIIFHFILPPVEEAIHLLNNIYTQFMLNFTHHLPKSFDLMLRVPEFPPEFLMIYLCGILCLGIIVRDLSEKRKETQQDWVFI